MDDLYFNDEYEQLKQNEAKRAEIQHCVNSSISSLMKNKEGRVFLRTVLDMAGTFNSFNGTEAQLLAFEGKRTVGVFLFDMIKKQDRNNVALLFKEE